MSCGVQLGWLAPLLLFPSWLMLAFGFLIAELGEQQGRDSHWGGGPGAPQRSSVLLRAGRTLIQGNVNGPRGVQTALGAFSKSNVSSGHPRTGLTVHELLPWASHWPTLEAAKRYLGHRLSSKNLHFRDRGYLAFRKNST